MELVHVSRYTRGVQVQEDAQRRRPRHWLALDDDLEGWPDSCRQTWSHATDLVARDGNTGLSNPKVQHELREKLHSCHIAASAKSSNLQGV